MEIKQTYLHHVVLISFLADTPQEMREEIANKYATLGDDAGGKEAGVLFWSVKPNMDTRKNIHLVEIAIFKDNKSFEDFKNNPKHIEVVELLKKSANWTVGDIMESFPNIN